MAGSFTTSEKTSLLFKKLLGAPSTLETTQFFSEPARPARAAVFQSQFYSEEIPTVAPADLANVTTDDLGSGLSGSVVGKTSSTSPMIKKYLKVPLTVVAGTNDCSYECALDDTYGRVLQDAVPFNYDPNGSYLFVLYKNDGTTVIPFGTGDYLLDTESGILTFYSPENITGVTAAAPPKISFYRYVGLKGAATTSQTTESISDTSLVFTKPITFDGGDSTQVSDTLAAIVLDDRDLSALSSSTPCMSLNFGDTNVDGSWRLVTYGGDGVATATSFHVETRQSGSWVTKSSFYPQ
jgi:hypothetical protein